MRTLAALLFALLMPCAARAGCCIQPASYTRPERYSQFVDASTYPGGVTAAIYSGQRYLYLPQGSYTLQNPVVIDRNQPLVIHGQSSQNVFLVANDPTQPLFVVRRATLFQLGNLTCIPFVPRNASADCMQVNSTTSGAQLEAVNVDFQVARILILGPASFTCYDCRIEQGGLPDPLIVDHPLADVTWVGGDISNGGAGPIGAGYPDSYHAWQRQGRLRFYGTSVEHAIGRADFRFSSTSALGPNVLADLRSEGSNAGLGGQASSFAYVSPLGSANLVVKNCGSNWAEQGQGSGTDVLFNGTGTLWLYGNNGFTGVGKWVDGDTTNATIVAAGNTSFTDTGLLPGLGTEFTGDNVQAYRLRTGDVTQPKARQISVGQTLEGYGVAAVPAPPVDTIPSAPPWPVMDVLLPGFESVKSFGAVGNGVADDTVALQSALDAQCGGPVNGDGTIQASTSLYFPAGTYKITSRLIHNGTGAGCHNLSAGAWLAGQGAGSTRIVRTGAGGGVLVTFGMTRSIIQGIEFDAAAAATQSAVGMEWEGLDSTQLATQYNWMTDLHTVGGAVGVGMGLEIDTPGQDSDLYVVNSRIEGATVGVASGHFNALSNMCLGCVLLGNASAWGQVSQGAFTAAGTLFVYDSKIRGTTTSEITGLGGSASAILSERASDSDSPVWYIDPSHDAGNATTLQLEQVTAIPTGAEASILDWGLAGGVTLLDSSFSRIAATIDSTHNAASLLSLYSTIGDSGSTTLTGSHAQQDLVSTRP